MIPSMNSNRNKLVLASGSPRRREIIQALDIDVEIVSPGGEEGPPLPDETPEAYVIRLSQEKAQRAAVNRPNAVILSADTSVVLGSDILGKPASHNEAVQMLERLRGRNHQVITGFTILDATSGKSLSGAKSSEIYLRNFSDKEIADYVASGESLDKAGAYAVQDKNFRPAHRTEGCYLNIVGLPLCEVIQQLCKIGLDAKLRKGWQLPDECENCPLKLMQEEVTHK